MKTTGNVSIVFETLIEHCATFFPEGRSIFEETSLGVNSDDQIKLAIKNRRKKDKTLVL